jgi:dTDP-4-amino-4,6-dideoxygalactose transaminase
MSEPIPLCEPTLRGPNVRAYIEECVATNFVSSVGPFVDRFERDFAAYVGARYAVACASGTAALHVAMRLLGVGDGAEVLVPTLTFIASANPVVYERARVVLCDSERATWNMDPALACEEIERRARTGARQLAAVEAVHLLGHPAQLDELAEVCARHGVALIEDASEALGARWTMGRFAGKHVGTVGRIGCFSFNGNKIITTGGGGMITTDDAELARRAKHLTTQARLPGPEYRHDEVGYNYRLTNLAAALGVAQLEELPGFVADKHRIAARYDAAIAELAGLAPPPRAAWAAPSLWLYTALVDPAAYGCDRVELLARFAAQQIQTRPIWSPLHTMPMYRDATRLGDTVADEIFARALSLPCSASLTESQQAQVLDVLRAR